jgi:predicted ATPase with chaperone activity
MKTMNWFRFLSKVFRRRKTIICQSKNRENVEYRTPISARAYDRILKVARTAADLAGSKDIRIARAGRGEEHFDIRCSVFCGSKL